MLKGCPAATVVDLTHGVPPWDVVTAAVTIRTSFAFFPAGSVHLVVVDLGAGGRRPIPLPAAAATCSSPRTTASSPCSSLTASSRPHRVAHADRAPTSASPTFHGRDLMGAGGRGPGRGPAPEDLGLRSTRRKRPGNCGAGTLEAGLYA